VVRLERQRGGFLDLLPHEAGGDIVNLDPRGEALIEPVVIDDIRDAGMDQ
jgi:hypothetical protein